MTLRFAPHELGGGQDAAGPHGLRDPGAMSSMNGQSELDLRIAEACNAQEGTE
jgi:hypothetical protein